MVFFSDQEVNYQDKTRQVYGDDFTERLHLLIQAQLERE